MSPLSLVFGAVVGLSLGLTGGGGAIFAVPLLVYGLGVAPREAVVVSLMAVGTTALVGFLEQWRRREVEIRTGLLLAVAGMPGTPAGAWLAHLLPETVLMLLFAGLMAVVGARLWRQASRPTAARGGGEAPNTADAARCQRDGAGALVLSSRCAKILALVGVVTGVLAGLFGVGGGVVIVPALILVTGMSIHRAVGTSLLVVTLVSATGVVSQWWAGRVVDPELTATFVAGSIGGLFVGRHISRRLPAGLLQKVFAVAIFGTALFVVVRNVGVHWGQ